MPEENVVRLEKNGIEYYYPRELLARIFGVAKVLDEDIVLVEEMIRVGDVTKKKQQVADEIFAQMDPNIDIDEEISQKILSRIRSMLREERT